jgi:hypothetical protein
MKKKLSITPKEYVQKLDHLPDFMKDFHDQKDLFKAIEELYGENESYKEMGFNWQRNHIYIIDYFLWFMGQHGYKLQKTRADVDFYDIQASIKDLIDKRNKKAFSFLKPQS